MMTGKNAPISWFIPLHKITKPSFRSKKLVKQVAANRKTILSKFVETKLNRTSLYHNAVSHLDVLVVMLSGNVAVLRALLYRRHFRLSVEEVTMVDRLLRARPPPVPLSRVLWLASFLTLSALHLAYVSFVGGALHALSHVPNQFNYQLIYTMEALFAEETDSIFRRFRTLNARLESTCLGAASRYPLDLHPGMIPVGETSRKLPAPTHALRRGAPTDKSSTRARTKSFYSGVPEFDGVPIHQLEDAHALLCSSALNLTRRYGPVLLIDVLNLLLHFVTTAYFFFSMIVVDAKLHQNVAHRITMYVYVTLQGLWMLAHVSRLVLLVQPCSNVKEEANETGALVGTFLNMLHPCCHLRKQLELFSMQLMHQRVGFSPCGLFELDLKLLLSLLGAVTTYLVVLFQIRVPSTNVDINTLNRTV
ncbi:gustatory receptor for sugar taste 43a-like [Frankliniella occidentalis]|uniref:Gustatory receptor n=1 Tax=Frankliniella occidentalis TaxID=133901 RepID=A0A6J1RV93_FRAOC|nr:gustatory receptor for sugar taste 43a-like [Frankliniella occidentalis]